MLAGWDGEAVFVPGEVPRAGVLALWGAGTGPDLVEVVVPCNTWGVRKRWAAATLVPVAEALPALLAVDPNAPGSGAAWGCGPPPPWPGWV